MMKRSKWIRRLQCHSHLRLMIRDTVSGVGVFLFRVLYHRKATAAFIKREIKVTTAKPGHESI